jgi:hypothetical protein
MAYRKKRSFYNERCFGFKIIEHRQKNIDNNIHQTIENKIEEFQRMAMGFQNGLE